MLFSIEKCQILQVGKKRNTITKMCGVKLNSVQGGKDLGVKIASNIKFLQHCNDAANKANRMLAFVKRGF